MLIGKGFCRSWPAQILSIFARDNELSDAGLRGALRTAQILIENGIATRVATLPLGEKQQNARQQLKDRFGLNGPADSPKAAALEGRSEEETQLARNPIGAGQARRK
jgi:hypothetical protein